MAMETAERAPQSMVQERRRWRRRIGEPLSWFGLRKTALPFEPDVNVIHGNVKWLKGLRFIFSDFFSSFFSKSTKTCPKLANSDDESSCAGGLATERGFTLPGDDPSPFLILSGQRRVHE